MIRKRVDCAVFWNMGFPSMYIGLCDVSATEWYSFGDPEVKAFWEQAAAGGRRMAGKTHQENHDGNCAQTVSSSFKP
jgi:hypothetical protein